MDAQEEDELYPKRCDRWINLKGLRAEKRRAKKERDGVEMFGGFRKKQ